jgi:CubicO group peptidase (beta-lactamase class C family)
MNKDKWKRLEEVISADYNNIAGVVILKDEQVIYENYFSGCSEDSSLHVFSVTKSVMSILLGIAIDKGYINSINQKILDFFPEYKPRKGEKVLQQATVKDLITMTLPYKYKFPFVTYMKYFMSKDSVKFCLDLAGGKNGAGRFNYEPIVGLDILSGILVKATGQSILDFAVDNLFRPLEITVAENIVLGSAKEQRQFNQSTHTSGWVSNGKGVNTGSWGLTLSVRDMAKVGQLYLSDGIWRGEQIVCSSWVKDSTKKHNYWDKMNLAYGYLWWVIDEEENVFAAMGDSGNVIYCNKEKSLTVSIVSKYSPKAKDRLPLIKGYIEAIV